MAMIKKISRRTYLVSSASFLAVPALESFAGAEPREASKRMLFIGQGYGFTNKNFYPTQAGRFSEHGLPESMKPLLPHADDLCMVDRLNNLGWLGTHAGSDGFLRAGGAVSCDVLAGSYLSANARYQNLIVNTSVYGDGHGRYGLSWGINGDPIPGISSSLGTYQKLFGGDETKEAILQRIKEQRSVLDSVKTNGRFFATQLSSTDKNKLDEYLQSVRQIEQELEKEIAWIDVPRPNAPFPYLKPVTESKGDGPSGLDGIKDIKLVYDMIALAFQSGQTNVASFTLPNQAVLTSMGIDSHIHQLSHYNASKDLTEKSMQRDFVNMELLSYALSKLKATKDADGRSLFDTTLVAYGTNLNTGHSVQDVPFILAGGGMKRLRRGEYVRPNQRSVPLGNAWLTILQEMGVNVERFGHSTGTEASFLT